MSVPSEPVAIQGVHHFAYKCRDAKETREFYETLLGLPLVAVLEEKDVVTTTGERLSFIHFFFQMADGNHIAFFDFGDGLAPAPDPATPRFANHIAFTVKDEADLLKAKARLEGAGLRVDGPLEHEFVRSIYFWDPNGIRLEYAYTIWGAEKLDSQRRAAAGLLESWTQRTAQSAS